MSNLQGNHLDNVVTQEIPEAPYSKKLLYWTAGLSCATVVAHAVNTPGHISEWWGYATFFVLVSAMQFFLGVVLFLQPWRHDADGKWRSNPGNFARPYFKLGTILSSSILVIYAISRTTGMPFFGPDAKVEPVTLLNLVPITQDAVLTVFFISLLWRTR